MRGLIRDLQKEFREKKLIILYKTKAEKALFIAKVLYYYLLLKKDPEY